MIDLDANAQLVMTTERKVVLLITVSLDHADYAKHAMRRAGITPVDAYEDGDRYCIVVNTLDQTRAERAIARELT
jgi:hypothetical protein